MPPSRQKQIEEEEEDKEIKQKKKKSKVKNCIMKFYRKVTKIEKKEKASIVNKSKHHDRGESPEELKLEFINLNDDPLIVRKEYK